MKRLMFAMVVAGWVASAGAEEAAPRPAAAVSQELPKIMYVVPWKKLDDSGVDETGRPQSLILGLDTNVMDPIQHRRQVHFERVWQASQARSAKQ